MAQAKNCFPEELTCSLYISASLRDGMLRREITRREAAGGKMGRGEVARGEAAQGETAQGQAAPDELAAAEAAQDETNEGEAPQGKAAESGAAQGEAGRGEVAQHETAQGEVVPVEVTEGEAAHSGATQGEIAQGEAAKGEAAKGEAAPGETATGEVRAGDARPEASGRPPEDAALKEQAVAPPQPCVSRAALEAAIRGSDPEGKWAVTETGCGLIASFANESDAERLLACDLATALGGPVHVARFSHTELRYRQNVVIRDIPWAIPLQDVIGALRKQGVSVGKIERIRQHIRAEVLNPGQLESLLRHGLDFFGAARFAVMAERPWHGPVAPGLVPAAVGANGGAPGPRPAQPMFEACAPSPPQQQPQQIDVLQCYRCQGFWHVAANCRHLPRCVRCGEPHSVQFCPRPRHDPICCHCQGPHHAAYRHCPVRLQLINSTPVSITLSSERAARGKPLWFGMSTR